MKSAWLSAFVDNLVHGPQSAPAPQFATKNSSSGERQERSLTPTVVPNDVTARDANDNPVAGAAAEPPIETIVAAANYSHKRRSTHLHQSYSGGSAGSGEISDGCGRNARSRDKRLRLDP